MEYHAMLEVSKQMDFLSSSRGFGVVSCSGVCHNPKP